MLILKLSASPNPDMGQTEDPAPPEEVEVEDLYEARTKAAEYIRKHHLGSGNFGAVVEQDGEPYASISFNLRIWTPEQWPDCQPHPDVYDPHRAVCKSHADNGGGCTIVGCRGTESEYSACVRFARQESGKEAGPEHM